MFAFLGVNKCLFFFFLLCFFKNELIGILPTLLILLISWILLLICLVCFSLNWCFCSHHGYPPTHHHVEAPPLPLFWVGAVVPCVPYLPSWFIPSFCWSLSFSNFPRKRLLMENKFVSLITWKCYCSILKLIWPFNWI